MNRRVSAFVAIAFIFFMAAAAVTTFLSCSRNEEMTEKAPIATEETTQYKTYVVKEYDGMVAVFEKGENKPFRITDTYVSSLPQADRDNLKNGIEVTSKEKLRRLVEDLCS